MLNKVPEADNQPDAFSNTPGRILHIGCSSAFYLQYVLTQPLTNTDIIGMRLAMLFTRGDKFCSWTIR